MTLSVPVTTADVFELLNSVVQNTGAAILPIWGVTSEGVCCCPKGVECNSPGKHPHGKFCPQGVKNATRDTAVIRQWLRQAPNINWGLRCGEPCPGGGFLGVFDWDPRNGSAESLEDIRGRGDELPDTVTQVSGGGGGHRLYKFPHPPASRSLGPGLDLQGAGKYIVIAPSKHHSKGLYTWEIGQGPGEAPIANAPEWMATDEAQPRPERESARQTVLGEAFFLAGRAGPVMPSGEMYVNCPQSHLHSDARGLGEDASCIVMPPAGGSRFGGFKCQHGHCANLKWHDVVRLLPKEAVDQAHKKYPRLVAVPSTPDSLENELKLIEACDTANPDVESELNKFKSKLHYKPKGKGYELVKDIINLNIILSHDPRWKGLLKYDDFAQILRFTRPPPWHPDDTPKEKSNVWQDNHVSCLDLWCRRTWQLELPSEKLREGVYVVGRRDAINPLQDYLNGLKWDGTPRLETWLAAYAGVDDTAYSRVAGRKWLLSAVARAFDNGCKVDTLIVLEGPQGKGKSTLLRTLVPDPSWFSDTPFPIGEKDSYMALRGKWIIELAELASLKKADLDRAKAFFSSPSDSYRPPYGRDNVTIPRTVVFAGTVNAGEYLNDATGARRFVPVKCGVIDIPTLTADRDQIWAEVVQVYKAWVARGSKVSEALWWASAEETPMFEEQQIQRQVAGASNPWLEAISMWTQTTRCKDLLKSKRHITLRDVANLALNIEDKNFDTSTATAIGIILARDLGWKKERVKCGGSAKTWGYSPL